MVATSAGDFRARYVINCAGLYSDAIARMAGCKTDLEIVPFRGEYYEVKPERRFLVRTLFIRYLIRGFLSSASTSLVA